MFVKIFLASYLKQSLLITWNIESKLTIRIKINSPPQVHNSHACSSHDVNDQGTNIHIHEKIKVKRTGEKTKKQIKHSKIRKNRKLCECLGFM